MYLENPEFSNELSINEFSFQWALHLRNEALNIFGQSFQVPKTKHKIDVRIFSNIRMRMDENRDTYVEDFLWKFFIVDHFRNKRNGPVQMWWQ